MNQMEYGGETVAQKISMIIIIFRISDDYNPILLSINYYNPPL